MISISFAVQTFDEARFVVNAVERSLAEMRSAAAAVPESAAPAEVRADTQPEAVTPAPAAATPRARRARAAVPEVPAPAPATELAAPAPTPAPEAADKAPAPGQEERHLPAAATPLNLFDVERAPPAAPAVPTKANAAPTRADVDAAMKDLYTALAPSGAGKAIQASIDILARHGVTTVRALKEEAWPQLLADVRAVIAGKDIAAAVTE